MLSLRAKTELGILAALIALGALAGGSWLVARGDRIRLQAALDQQAQTIVAATQREKERDAALKDTIQQIARIKDAVQTPQRVVQEIPKYLPALPQPIEIKMPDVIPGKPASDQLPATAAIPQQDLKPIFDAIQDCRVCQARLSAAEQSHQDDAVKLAAVSRERDAALTAARGGSFWQRTRRAAKWFLIGAAAGAVALSASRR